MSELKRSWVQSANAPDTEFPLNNLPYGVFSTSGGDPRCGVAIGDQILDVAALEAGGHLSFAGALQSGSWNAFMAQGPAAWADLRRAVTDMLAEGSEMQEQLPLVPISAAQAAHAVHRDGVHGLSMPRAITPPMWGRCSGARKTPCRPTGCTCRLGTTGGPLR